MTIGEMISFEAPRLLGRYLTEQTSSQSKELLLVARDALLFISELGQDYRFEDFRRNSDSSSIAPLLTEAVGRLKRLQGELHSPEEQELVEDRLQTQFVGSPGQVAERLRQLQEATDADELLITSITHDHDDRVRSHELLAKHWETL